MQYLSDEWLDEAAAALAAAPALTGEAAEVDLTVAYEVTAAPGGKCSYAVRLSEGRLSLERPSPKDPPVSFTLDYDTAAEVARGDVSVQAAFMQGRLKLGGDVTVLLRDAGALAGIDDALADLRARTEY
ncbi:MAG: SCP2 sterol-binding domain-containing protein [Microthrixaceae bacterium]